MKIHFIGIGGIGVSALAKYYLAKGHKVSGSDLVSSEITDTLKKQGAKITIGKHKATNVPKNAGMVIYSPAVRLNNLEFQRAKKLKIKCLSYPQALGELTKQYFTIAVSGTHGKSTTTSILGLSLTKAGFDPTVIVGTKLKEFENSNCRVGKSKYLIIEADEHFASFLNYWPKIIVITNIEADHLDYYKNLKNLRKAFNEFIGHLPKDGVLITNKSIDKRAFPKLKKTLKVPGAYNIYNASLALAVARTLKIPDQVSFKALSDYKGCWRRFEEKKAEINNKKIILVSDYAHHPTEIKATLKAAREKYPSKKIWCIYQPHQYQRTYYLFDDFVRVFKRALVNKLIITDIYDVAGREEKKIKEKVNSAEIVKAIKKPWAFHLPKEEIIDYLKENLKGGEVVIIMGAGDIYNLFLGLTRRRRKDKIN
jgi:UDP-N-acetylmuramate--alanine ligase